MLGGRSSRESAERLGLVTRGAMVAALVRAVEAPPADGVRIVDVPAIRFAVLNKRSGDQKALS